MCYNYPRIKLEPAFRTLEDKTEHLSSHAHVVHTTAKHVISRRRKTRTSSKCQKMKNARAKRAEVMFFFLSNLQICRVLVSIVVLVALKLPLGNQSSRPLLLTHVWGRCNACEALAFNKGNNENSS